MGNKQTKHLNYSITFVVPNHLVKTLGLNQQSRWVPNSTWGNAFAIGMFLWSDYEFQVDGAQYNYLEAKDGVWMMKGIGPFATKTKFSYDSDCSRLANTGWPEEKMTQKNCSWEAKLYDNPQTVYEFMCTYTYCYIMHLLKQLLLKQLLTLHPGKLQITLPPEKNIIYDVDRTLALKSTYKSYIKSFFVGHVIANYPEVFQEFLHKNNYDSDMVIYTEFLNPDNKFSSVKKRYILLVEKI